MNAQPILVKGADLLGQGRADLLIVDGRIERVGESIEAPEGARVIDAEGLIALPGLVDLRAHLGEPGREDAETIASGARAAARGGYTAVMALPDTDPVTDTATDAEWVLDAGAKAPHADVFPIGAVTKERGGAELAEMGLMARSRAKVRLFSDANRCVADGQIMRRALEYGLAFDAVVAQHARDPQLAPAGACCDESDLSGRLGLAAWPAVAEESIVARDVMLARTTGGRLHVSTVSTAGTVELIRWAKSQGVQVTAEVTPHHLVLTSQELTGYDSRYKVEPPLRTQSDVDALRAGLVDGTIDVVATDHDPQSLVDKQHDFTIARPGALGLETALAVVHHHLVRTGLMTWADVAEAMSVRPARIAGLEGHGRPLQEGEPANITLVDPDATFTVDENESVSVSRNEIWHGRELSGRVVTTILRGEPTLLDGELVQAGGAEL